jgi:monothiol glutaredoxin
MKPKHVRLFIKPSCPWCHEAIDWLHEHSIGFEELDVTNSAAARKEMIELTDQSRAPCIEVDGHILADFGTDELEPFLKNLGYSWK